MEVFRLLVQRHVDHVREDEGKEITDDEALGLLIAKFAKWNGVRILGIAQAALTDARFLDESKAVVEIRQQLLVAVNTK